MSLLGLLEGLGSPTELAGINIFQKFLKEFPLQLVILLSFLFGTSSWALQERKVLDRNGIPGWRLFLLKREAFLRSKE